MSESQTIRELERQKDEVMEMYLFASPEDRVKLLVRHMELQEAIENLVASSGLKETKPVKRRHRRRRVLSYL